MNTQEFLRLILPPQGKHFFIVTIAASGRPTHYHTTNIDNAAHCAVKRDQDSDANVYYGMASYKTEAYTDNKGKKRKRTQDNVDQLNCFWIDLDCKGRGGDRDYPSQRDAILDIASFRKAANIPRPTAVVNSGYGLHMYWVLDEAISVNEWATVASDWRDMLDKHGVKHDSSCTTDSARILRPIGAHNKKTGQDAREVTLIGGVGDKIRLEDFVRPLSRKSEATMQPLQTMSSGVDMELNALAESAVEYPPSSVGEIIKSCALMREVAQLGGDVSYDLWRGALGIVKHTIEGAKAAPLFSRKHKDYTAEATLEKMNSWETGPATCEFMSRAAISDRIDVCSKCTHRGGVKSPIQLGYAKTVTLTETIHSVTGGDPITTVVEIPAFPPAMKDFDWVDGRIIRKVVDKEAKKKNEQGTEPEMAIIPVCGHMFYPSGYYRDESEKHQMVWMLREHEGVYREFTLTGSALGTSGAALFKELGEAGVTSISAAAKPHLESYISKWVNEIKRQQKGTETFTRFGWYGNDFLHGDTMYCASGDTKKVRLAGDAADLGQYLKPLGTLEKWKSLIDEAYNHEGAEAYQFLIGAGFGSLLIQFMGVAGGPVVSVTSYASGKGKTTAARNAFGIYGNPTESSRATLSSSSVTHKAIFAVAGVLHNYPVVVDEITNIDGAALSDTVYTWSQGQSRTRLRNTGELAKTGHGWSGILLSTSNMPALNIVAGVKPSADAEVMRLIEYDCSDTYRLDKDIADRVFAELKKNYGVAAEVFIPWLVANRSEVEATLRETQRSLDKRLGLMPEHRYWSAGYAVAVTGLVIARHLGLVKFDTQRILQWVETQKGLMVDRIKYTVLTAEESFGMMLKDIGPGLLVTDIEGGKGNKNCAFILQEPRGPMTGRVIENDGIALIAQPVVNAWCNKNKTDVRAMALAAYRAGWLLSEDTDKRYPGKGTNYTMGQVRCFIVNWAALESSASSNPQLAEVIQMFNEKRT